jgi:ABC-type sugar transport system ATPase subunit
MAELPNMSRFGIVNDQKEKQMAENFVSQLDIRLSSLDAPVGSLSGGNQQKTVLARWLATNPKLLILDEPTHGVDVGAKSEIYQLMRDLAAQGVSIILISSELPEILAMSHRIVVMHEGRVTATVHHSEATEDVLMAYATAVDEQAEVAL